MKESVRTEFFNQNAISVLPENAFNPKSPLQFARQIAALKNVKSFCEPFYVMDMGKVEELIEQWHFSLPRVQPFYSVNCNSDPVLMKLLAAHPFMGFNCSNNQTLIEALDYLPANRILYSNPILTRASLKQTAEKDVQLLSFQSARDLDRILLHHPNAELLLHVCVNEASEDPNALMAYPVEDAPELLQTAANSGANVVGISFNMGSGCVRPALYSSAIEVASRLFQLGGQLGFQMQVLNIGCGFSNLNQHFQKNCAYINDALDFYFAAENFPRLRIIATPGRFFASSVFSLVTNITGRRSVDLSMITNDDFDNGREAFIYQTNEGYYGGFGCRLNANIEPECTPLFDHYLDNFSNEHIYGSVVGPTLDDSDVIQPICRFRPMATGDWLMWRNMGAYSMNNRGSLDDVDEDYRAPIIFYFTFQTQWEHMGKADDSSLPTSPVHSEFGSDYDSLASTDETFYEEEEFMKMFGWPLHD